MQKGSPAEKGGILPGDTITRFGTADVRTWEHLDMAVAGRPNREVDVTVLREGREHHLKVTPDLTELRTRGNARFDIGTIGALPDVYPSVASFVPGKPAESSGLKVGDTILAVDGERMVFESQARKTISSKTGDRPIEFRVRRDGTLSTAPVMNASATPVPFAFTFTPRGRLASGEAAMSSLTTYRLNGDGTLTDPRSQSDGQMALCWITRARGVYYVSNTASDNVSSFRIGADGQPMLLNAVAAGTNAGPIDSTASGRYLYVQTGTAGTIDEFRVNGDGSLTPIGSVTGLPAGQEGIASN